MFELARTRALIRSDHSTDTTTTDNAGPDAGNQPTPKSTSHPSRSFLYRNLCVVCVFASIGAMVTIAFAVLFPLIVMSRARGQPTRAVPTRKPLPRSLEPDVIPHHYDIKIETDFLKFAGNVTIHMTCVRSTSSLRIYVTDLTLLAASIRPRVGFPTGPDTPQVIPARGKSSFVTLLLSWNLEPRTDYRLSIRYESPLRTSERRGLFMEVSESYFTVASFLEHPDVPMLIPSLDDLGMKMTFSVSLFRPNSTFAAISSWDLLKDLQHDDGSVQSVFERTAPIPSYQLGLAITNLPKTTDGFTSLRAHPREAEKLNYLLGFCTDVIEKAAEATGKVFPLKGIDLLAVRSFPRACHSTWRLFVVRADVFTAVDTHWNLELASLRITLEILSIWFGGLSSVGSWVDNGLALLYAIKVIKLIKPQWLMDDVLHAYRFVALSNAVGNTILPNTSSLLFDHAVDHHAVSILSMFRSTIGQDSFQKATTKFLEDYERGNATEADFWGALKDASGIDNLPQYARFWRSQPDYPCVNVSRIDAETIHLVQAPFCYPHCVKSKDQLPVWPIPITFTYASEPKKIDATAMVIWMATQEMTLKVPQAHFNDWVLINVDTGGVYRVDYHGQNWDHLIRQLRKDPTDIPVPNRAQILDDLFHFAYTGHRSYEKFLRAAEYLGKEREALPWVHYTRLVEAFPAKAKRTLAWASMNRRICWNIVAEIAAVSGKFADIASTSPKSVFEAVVLRHCCRFAHAKCPKNLPSQPPVHG
ncbi:unnamed protein product [Ixodes hexagonus]